MATNNIDKPQALESMLTSGQTSYEFTPIEAENNYCAVAIYLTADGQISGQIGTAHFTTTKKSGKKIANNSLIFRNFVYICITKVLAQMRSNSILNGIFPLRPFGVGDFYICKSITYNILGIFLGDRYHPAAQTVL